MDRDVKYFPFYDSVKNPITQSGISSPCYNAGYDTLILEISGADSISATVEGCVNSIDSNSNSLEESDCPYTSLSIMDKEYNFIDSITSDGIYYIAINGCSRVRINTASITGSARIVGALEK